MYRLTYRIPGSPKEREEFREYGRALARAAFLSIVERASVSIRRIEFRPAPRPRWMRAAG